MIIVISITIMERIWKGWRRESNGWRLQQRVLIRMSEALVKDLRFAGYGKES